MKSWGTRAWGSILCAITMLFGGVFVACSDSGGSGGDSSSVAVKSISIADDYATKIAVESDTASQKSVTLTATILPEDATDKTILWEANGFVTPLSGRTQSGESITFTASSEGTATITATSADHSKTATVVITVIAEAKTASNETLADTSAFTIGGVVYTVNTDGTLSTDGAKISGSSITINQDGTVTIILDGDEYTASADIDGTIDTSTLVDEDGDPVETYGTIQMYKLNADDDLADGKLTDFGGNRAFFYLPQALTIGKDTAAITATVKTSNTSGFAGPGLISVKGISAKSAVVAGSSGVKSLARANGYTWVEDFVANKEYTFKAIISSEKLEFEIWDGKKLVAYKDNNVTYDGWLIDTANNWSPAQAYLALGVCDANNGTASSADIEFSNIKVTVNADSASKQSDGSYTVTGGTTYVVNEVIDNPDKTVLSVDETAVELNVDDDATKTYSIEYLSLDKEGNASVPTIVSSDPAVATAETTTDGDSRTVIKVIGVKAGTATLTITSAVNAELVENIAVTVISLNSSTTYSAAEFYPANNATAAYEDGELMLGGWASAPELIENGVIKILDSDGKEVDSIAFAGEVQFVAAKTVEMNVGTQLVRVADKKLYFTPHIGALEYGKTYTVAIPSTAIKGSIGRQVFDGLGKDKWKFTVRSAPTVSSTITVDGSQTSTANFRTIQGALDAIAEKTGDYKIQVAKGTYRELLYYAGAANVEIEGQTDAKYGADVEVAFTNGQAVNSTEKTRNLFEFAGSGNLILDHIKLNNTYSRAQYKGDAQAEAIGVDNGKTGTFAAYNCTFLSHQDTIRTVGKGWIYDSYIEGDTDFIWMEIDGIDLLVENCEIVCPYDEYASSHVAYITAPRMTKASEAGKGLVVYNSKITVETQQEAYLGRTPWNAGYYSQAAFINTPITAKGTAHSDWSNASIADGILDKYVGWKRYNVTGGTESSAGSAYSVVLEQEFVGTEYAGRNNILNRLFDVTYGVFKYDATNNWDVNALASAQGWNVAEDTSVAKFETEQDVTSVTYDICALAQSISTPSAGADGQWKQNDAFVDGYSSTGTTATAGTALPSDVSAGIAWKNLKYHSGSSSYGAVTSSVEGSLTEITIKVEGPRKITWSGSTYSNNALTVTDSTGKKWVDNVSTKEATDKTPQGFLYTGTGAETFTLAFTKGSTYINKIVVSTISIETERVTGLTLTSDVTSILANGSTDATLRAALTTTFLSTDTTVNWTITSGGTFAELSDTNGASITVKGKNAGAGKVTVRATSALTEETYDEVTLEVTEDSVAFTIADGITSDADGNVTIVVDRSVGKVSAIATSKDGNDITYTSSNEKIFTVNAKGKVKGVSLGKATLTATSSVGAYATATVIVTQSVPTDDMTFDFTPGTIFSKYENTLDYGVLKINPGNKNAYAYNGTQHGAQFKDGNTVEIKVLGASVISLGGCKYSASGNNVTVTAANSGTIQTDVTATQTSACYDADGTTLDYTYTGTEATTITIAFSGSVYVPVIIVKPAE